MKPEQLLQHFEQVAEAPDAVPRLRRFILDLAVRGKLVEQDPADELASELLKRIEAEKKRLAKAGEIRKEKPLLTVDEDATPFDLPATWGWVPIRQIATDRGQKIPKQKFSYIDVSAIDKERGIIVEPQVLAPDGAPSRARKIVQRGDVIYSCVRPYLLNIAVVEEEFDPEPIVSTAFAVLNGLGLVLPRYLWIVLRSPYFVGCVEEKMRGQAYPAINDGDFAPLPIPLPPLAEQHRIVAKVDELMALCDDLGAAQAKRERRRDRLVATTLHGLNNGDASAEPASRPTFEDSARFYFNNLPRLTTRPEHIHQLRHTILNLAVRGKLVPQDLGDEPVAALLQRIDHERAITATSDRRAEGDPRPLLAGEFRWRVPPTWGWRGLADLALFIDYRGRTPTKCDSGIRLITAKNVRRGFVNLEPEEFVAEATYKAWMTRGLPRTGDILFTTEAPMGNAAVVRLHEKFGLAQRVINFRPYGGLDSDFLVLQILSAPFQAILDETATGLTAKGIKAAKLQRLPIAVPPLAEQHRIVAKVDELMPLCEEMESQLTTTATTRRQLVEAYLAEALEGGS